ncbi:MAG: tetratricopeptide repeat protein [Alphaproteobacteria bacterium]|nr:tetratricopeptide repeat protein [Alphaproteobacteria bacterium]
MQLHEALELALQHHNAGELSQAEFIYRRILDAEPNQPGALHLLGVLSLQTGNKETAADLLSQAAEIDPDNSETHVNLGVALQALGRLAAAVESYRRAVAIEPDYAEAHNNLGVSLRDLGRLDEAVEHYRKALAIRPDYAGAHFNLGTALRSLGQLEAAVVSYRDALAIKPDYAEAYVNMGIAQQYLEQLDAAVESYHTAIEIDPEVGEARINLGSTLMKLGRFEDALAAFEAVDTPLCRARRLECLFALGDYEAFFETPRDFPDGDETNIRAATINAFASHQLDRADPHRFCPRPLDFVRAYKNFDSVDDVDGFLRQLTAELKSRDAVWEPHRKSTIGGFQTPSILFDDPTGRLAELKRIVLDKIAAYRTEFAAEDCAFITRFPENFSLKAWFVRLLKDGHQNAHIHASGWLSGVFYVHVPAFEDQEQGAIEFSLWGYDYPVLNDAHPKKRHSPTTGDIVLFPSSLFHRTIPFQADEERMIVAFDVVPKP